MDRPSSPPRQGKRSIEPASNPYETLSTLALVAFIAAVVVLDLATNRRDWISVMLLVVPGLAASVCSVRRTAAFGALTVVTLTLLYGVSPRYGDTLGDWLTIAAAALISLVCVAVCRYRLQRERALVEARVTLRALQRTLLQPLPMRAPDVEIHGFYSPAKAEALVGGDIYDAVESPYGTRLLIGDVQGKGLDAIQTGAAVLSAFRESGYYLPTVAEVADRLEQAVARHNRRAARSGQEERFVTALLAEFAADGAVAVIDCGHVAPLLVSDTEVRELECATPGVPLGLADLVGQKRGVRHIDLRQGELLVLCTDGVLEARDASGSFYPLLTRLAHYTPAEPAVVAHELRADLERYVNGCLGDDAAALVVVRLARTRG
ncbi:PP2C family protein-serine/threonine phosphatase [Streptantibioticus ferralitis]|uniref:PP2C family protein-serine/threonine phosphatase n=1 Tax=Streptantibioticus ferralitis TaxID=236510 RepID=A0ABT5Z0H8_9ACTN|nr:PP2C family protein-serine/threonine phosphatase [Streptantibioticus ferralitis]MDF2257279.1 PP2C family protein-serine/threonine phosphatase [Streptantibioticus ferralitis]